MTMPLSFWVCLLLGAILLIVPLRRGRRAIVPMSAWLATLAMAYSVWQSSHEIGESTVPLPALALVWWLSFGWTNGKASEKADEWQPALLGCSLLTVGGLILLTHAENWLELLVSTELVRRATSKWSRRRTGEMDFEEFVPFALVVGIAGQVLVTGSTEWSEWRAVLRDSYHLSVHAAPIGRGSLILIASIAMLIFAACAPVFFSWRWEAGDDVHSADWTRIIANSVARQLAALMALARLLAGGVPGMESICLAMMIVLALSSWCVSIRWLVSSQRFDRSLAGWALCHWASLLLWTAAAMTWQTASATLGTIVSSASFMQGWPGAVTAFTATLGAAVASTRALTGEQSRVCYWDEWRGLGNVRTFSCVLLVIPLASLSGFPAHAGFWIRLQWLMAMLSVHQLQPDESWSLQRGLALAALAGVAAWLVSVAMSVRLVRTLWQEPDFGNHRQASDWWPRSVSVVVAVAIIVSGCWPQWLIW